MLQSIGACSKLAALHCSVGMRLALSTSWWMQSESTRYPRGKWTQLRSEAYMYTVHDPS